MTRARYNYRESINRILRIFEGKALPTDNPETLTGEVLSTDEAASDLAELLAGSLPGESFVVPSGADLSAYTASNADTDTGTSTTKFVTPAGLKYNLETTKTPSNAEMLAGTSAVDFVTPAGLSYEENAWGEVYSTGSYTSIGTIPAGFPGDVGTRITGAFHNSYCDDVGVTVGADKSQLIITKAGTYKISWNLSLYASSAVGYTILPFMNSGSMTQASSFIFPVGTGTMDGMSGSGFISINSVPASLDLRVIPAWAFSIAWMKIANIRLTAQRVSKVK